MEIELKNNKKEEIREKFLKLFPNPTYQGDGFYSEVENEDFGEIYIFFNAEDFEFGILRGDEFPILKTKGNILELMINKVNGNLIPIYDESFGIDWDNFFISLYI